MLVMSDINPSYDSDQLPGANSNFGTFTGDLSGLNVSTLAQVIGLAEGASGDFFIGQVAASGDNACTEKTLTAGLSNVRGLCPEEPSKQGSYYSASVAYHGHINDISSITGDQKVSTYAVGLASPLPNINITIGTKTVTLVPFGKSVYGSGYIDSSLKGDFQPTNTIVDFYVDTITATYGKFRINYEDVEQGADHDMDAIAVYEYQVVDGSGNAVTDPASGVSVKITLTSESAAGGIIQHMGYIISGTTHDGTYLEIRDKDTSAGADVDYYLDTPSGQYPNGTWNDGADLPWITTRTFTPSTTGGAAAELLKNPLWYAGKWGGFEDQNDNDLPDLETEWDADEDGYPRQLLLCDQPPPAGGAVERFLCRHRCENRFRDLGFRAGHLPGRGGHPASGLFPAGDVDGNGRDQVDGISAESLDG